MRVPSYLACLLITLATARADYAIAHRYAIGGDKSRWDYLTLDPATRYLYVAHFTRFEVLNAETGAKVGELAPASRAHGVVIVPDVKRGFATSGNDDTIIVFDPSTLRITSRLKSTGSNPDAIQYDPATRKVYVVNGGSGSVAILDPQELRIEATVALDRGKLEQIGFDGRGRAFVNNEEKSVMYVFDTRTRKPIATWPLAPGEGGTGLAVDAAHHRVFAACGNRQLVVLDSDTGKVVATPAIGEDPDGVVFDPRTQRIYTSNSDRTLSILHEDTPDDYRLVQTLPTAEGAKQLTIDPANGRIFLPTGTFGPAPEAANGAPKSLPPVVPGSFAILVAEEKR